MAPRPFWKGYLKLSLVSCPVAMTPAVSQQDKIRFHTLNRATGHRVESRYVDAVTGKPVDEDDEVKGYPRGDDKYVMLEDEELEAVALESTHTLDIESFVPRESVGWVWLERPHFLTPDEPVGEEAYCVIRDAMKATDSVGLSRLVLYGREKGVMLEPRERGILAWTLRYGDEIRDPDDYFGRLGKAKPEAKLERLVEDLIEKRSRPWDPKLLNDPVQNHLCAIITAKRKGRKPNKAKPEAEPERPGNVVSIMDALRRSLESREGGTHHKGGRHRS